MSHRTKTLFTSATAALLVGSLAACGGGEDPSADPTESSTSTSASASPTTEPTPTKPEKPVLPAAAKPATKAGAEAFGEYFWDVMNYTYFTGDTTVFRSLSQPMCTVCQSIIDGVEKDYAQGGHYRGSKWQFESSTFVNQTDPKGPFAGKTVAHIGPQILDKKGKDHDTHFPKNRLTITLTMYSNRTGWKIGYMEVRDS